VAFDSGGFSELQDRGSWTIDDPQLVAIVRRASEQVGAPDFAAIRDWMCEPFMLAKTGKTIGEHQRLTIDSYAWLRDLAPEIPWLPVVQGWHADDYERHVEMYRVAGFDLRTAPRVGVGSICRRQATRDGVAIVERMADLGLRVHAFGVKVEGLRLFGHRIASADSMAWSSVARIRKMNLERCVLDGHLTAKQEPRRGAKNCANCRRWAVEWHRTRILGLPASSREICANPHGTSTE
jgi:hypothetical protein